jgi:hypothetical protein
MERLIMIFDIFTEIDEGSVCVCFRDSDSIRGVMTQTFNSTVVLMNMVDSIKDMVEMLNTSSSFEFTFSDSRYLLDSADIISNINDYEKEFNTNMEIETSTSIWNWLITQSFEVAYRCSESANPVETIAFSGAGGLIVDNGNATYPYAYSSIDATTSITNISSSVGEYISPEEVDECEMVLKMTGSQIDIISDKIRDALELSDEQEVIMKKELGEIKKIMFCKSEL